MAKTIRVLVVDDSALIRQMIGDFVTEAPGMELAGTARDGEHALTQIERLDPDIVTLDVQMPKMDGLAALDAILKRKPLPVIMVSSLCQRSAEVTLQALDRGALDYVAKPDGVAQAETVLRRELIHKIRSMAGADVLQMLRVRKSQQRRREVRQAHVNPNAKAQSQRFQGCCIALGISTGGPPALSGLFQTLEPPLPPIVVVQHMPQQFTGPFARRLDSLSAIDIKEAETGDVLQPDHAYVAPGAKHLHLHRRGKEVCIRIRDDEPVSGHKPSIDVMMQDAAGIFGGKCLGLIMTGMGYDGVQGCGDIRAAGGYVLGQDEETSDVYGMNKVAFTAGHVDKQFSLEELPTLIERQSRLLPQQSVNTTRATCEI